MKKKSSFLILIAVAALSFTTSNLFKDPKAPISNTGAPNFASPFTVRHCDRAGCHSDFAINTAGSVIATGLPSGTYAAGQVYNFTITITGSGAIWGFSIKAVNTVNNANVGVMSTTNANTIVQGTIAANTQELGHNAAVASATASYTYINLKWTAPVAPTANEQNIRFYIVGVAGDADGSELGDYVYSTTINATLSVVPVTLNSFDVKPENNNAVNVKWQTGQEINSAYFTLQTSANGNDWFNVANIQAKGNSDASTQYSFTDNKPIAFNSNIYYRLKIVDKDGTYKFSSIQVVKINHAGIDIYNISAQPLQANANVIFNVKSDENRQINILIADVNGKILFKQNNKITNGSNTIEIPATSMAHANGIVFITFTTNGYFKTFKQIVL